MVKYFGRWHLNTDRHNKLPSSDLKHRFKYFLMELRLTINGEEHAQQQGRFDSYLRTLLCFHAPMATLQIDHIYRRQRRSLDIIGVSETVLYDVTSRARIALLFVDMPVTDKQLTREEGRICDTEILIIGMLFA